MTAPTLESALDAVYASLEADNAELDARIADLKSALAAKGLKVAEMDPKRLAQNNREGRKLLQSYFRRRGVAVEFLKSA